MPRLTAQDFDQELLILFDAYVHGSVMHMLTTRLPDLDAAVPFYANRISYMASPMYRLGPNAAATAAVSAACH